MSRVRCPQKRCSFWLNDWCDADEIELDLATLSCMTFDEIEVADGVSAPGTPGVEDDDLELEWEDDAPIFEDDMDESLYGVDDGDPEFDDEEDDMLEEENHVVQTRRTQRPRLSGLNGGDPGFTDDEDDMFVEKSPWSF